MYKVLLIDDSAVDRTAVRRILQKMSDTVQLVETETARQGLAAANTQPFDCILLDYGLPDMEGIEILSHLIEKDFPVVILTGNEFEKVASATLQAGAQDYIEKSQLNPTRLYQAICSAKERQDLVIARKRAELESRRFARIITDSRSEIYVIDHTHQRFTLISKGALENLGLHATAISALHIDDLFPEFHNERFSELIAPLLTGQQARIRVDTEITRCDDTQYPSEVIIQLSKTQDITEIVFHATDLSERIAASEKIQQLQKMEALGVMTGGIAHDFNNMMTAVVGGLSLLSQQDLSDKGRRYLKMASDSVERAVRLTDRLLSYSRSRKLAPTTIDANEFLVAALPFLTGTLAKTSRISVSAAPCSLHVKVDETELESSLLNICLNAQDAMPDGGTISLSVNPCRIGEEEEALQGMTAGDYVVFAVSDTGCGIDHDILQRVFDPFFTTKEVGEGAGLGLSMVFGFARQSNGYAVIDSAPGHGSTVKLFLPAVQAEESSKRIEEESASQANNSIGAGFTVLVVEDDDAILSFVAMALEDSGFDVICAREGNEAMGKLATTAKIDLLFTDIVMPGDLSGVDVAERYRTLHPKNPVIFTTGYARDAVLPTEQLSEMNFYLPKPYDHSRLTELCSKALAAFSAQQNEVSPTR